MVNVSWIDAKRYCDWMSRKKGLQISLPTEVEWEYAARGPRSDLTTWFEPDRFVLSQEHRQVRPVGTVDADLSWCGAFDMGGNVAEWCFDNYDGKKLARQKNLTANPNDIYQYRGADERAQSAKEGIQKSIRGGSFGQSVYQCRTYNRRLEDDRFDRIREHRLPPGLTLAEPARSGGPGKPFRRAGRATAAIGFKSAAQTRASHDQGMRDEYRSGPPAVFALEHSARRLGRGAGCSLMRADGSLAALAR